MTELSSRAESFVCSRLQEDGWTILQRNFRTRRSEVDIIAGRGDVIVFVEVKFAGDDSGTVALGKIDSKKQSRIIHAASAYLSKNPAVGEVRFDVAIVRGRSGDMRIDPYIPDAFRPDPD